MLLFRKTYGLILGFSLCGLAIAAPMSQETIQLPNCLAKKIIEPYTVLAENKQFKIIELASSSLNDLSHLADKTACGRFINLSHRLKVKSFAKKSLAAKQLLEEKPILAKGLTHYEIKHFKRVTYFLAQINIDNILSTLTHLTSYHNRSSMHRSGLESIEWLKEQFDMLSMNEGRKDVQSYFIKTGDIYMQPSLVTVIGKDINSPAIVLGAHIDTLDGNMPGASDDGSGSAILLETSRLLLQSKLRFKRPIYIIWYAAEERGLVGSERVVSDFLIEKIPVKAVIQFDMAAYRHDETDKTIWIFRDYTDKALSSFLASLIETYVKVPVGYSECGYGCSDHVSWTAENIPAVFPFETSFAHLNPYIHSPNDKISTLNLEHMANFAKIAVAFAVELAS